MISEAAKKEALEKIRPIVEKETLAYADVLAARIREKIRDGIDHPADRAEKWDSSVRIGENFLDIEHFIAGACDGVKSELPKCKDEEEVHRKSISYLTRTYEISAEAAEYVLELVRTKDYSVLHGEKQNGFWAAKFAMNMGPCWNFFMKHIQKDLADLGDIEITGKLALADPNSNVLFKFIPFGQLTANSSLLGGKNYMLLPLIWYTYTDPNDAEATIRKKVKESMSLTAKK